MKRLLIVDGSNLLFQMFFGMPDRIVGKNGQPIQGVLGFVGALLKSIRMVNPTHVLVVFDGENACERKRLDVDYKANRVDYGAALPEESPFSQIDGVYAALDDLGIRYMETTECEADDIIAGYALSSWAQEVVISSLDSDFFQLVSNRVRVLRYRGKKTAIYAPEDIRERFGVAPVQYADFKALVGDASDNIRVAEKIGPKTAAQLICQFGSLESILCRVQEISKPSVRESVMKNAARLERNYRLIHLSGSENLPFPKEKLSFCDAGWSTGDVLRGIGLK